MPSWTKRTSAAGLGPWLLAAAAGCGTAYEYDEADDFPAGSGQEPADEALPYAPGPFGYEVGSIMPNLSFIGYAAPEAERQGPMKRIALAEFYNPTGAGVHGPGSAFPEGTAKPKALLLAMSGVWCSVCQDEARLILPGQYTKYKPQGGEFMVNLADSGMQNTPADQGALDAWVQNFVVDYPLVLDPRYRIWLLAPEFVWPTNYLIDPRTMRIVMAIAGVPLPAQYCGAGDQDEPACQFWPLFEDVLGGTYTLPE